MKVSKILAGIAVTLLCVGPAMANPDVESDLAAMQEQMKVLQQQVEAQQEQLEQQGEQLEEAQNVVRRTQEEQSAVSGLARFLETVEIDGSIAGSWFWNFNKPDRSWRIPSSQTSPNAGDTPGGVGGNTGFNGGFYPFTPDHNSFQVDQAWFGLAKTATEESRAGFGFDLLSTCCSVSGRRP
jgi:type II secretory pathway pseudopilin PulG